MIPFLSELRLFLFRLLPQKCFAFLRTKLRIFSPISFIKERSRSICSPKNNNFTRLFLLENILPRPVSLFMGERQGGEDRSLEREKREREKKEKCFCFFGGKNASNLGWGKEIFDFFPPDCFWAGVTQRYFCFFGGEKASLLSRRENWRKRPINKEKNNGRDRGKKRGKPVLCFLWRKRKTSQLFLQKRDVWREIFRDNRSRRRKLRKKYQERRCFAFRRKKKIERKSQKIPKDIFRFLIEKKIFLYVTTKNGKKY